MAAGFKRKIAAGILGLTVLALTAAGSYKYFSTAPAAIPGIPLDKAPDFTLLDHNGSIHSLHSYVKSKAVILAGFSNLCESASGFLQATPVLFKSLSASNIKLLFISTDAMAERIKIMEATAAVQSELPVLLDTSGVVSKSLGLTNFGEAIVVEPPQWKVIYRGDLASAIQFSGGGGEFPKVKACALPALQFSKISYAKDVAPLIGKKCLNCHSPERKFRPMLNSYEKLRNWSAMIRETLLTDRMPPFSADPLYGKYGNDISLNPEEKRLLVDWIDSGLIRDGQGDPLREFHGQPRAINYAGPQAPLIYSASMAQPAKIPPGGTNEYVYFQLGGPAPFDMWVSSFETLSTNPRQLHHEAVSISKYPLKHFNKLAEAERDEELVKKDNDGNIPVYVQHVIRLHSHGKDPYYLRMQNWGIGKIQPVILPETRAMFIPKGYFLILEAHYMGTGKVDSEQTTIKFYGERRAMGRRPVHSLNIIRTEIEIPPGVSSYKIVSKALAIRKDVSVLSFLAHMHMRGRSMKLVSTDPNGQTKTLASMPNFYYGWHTGSGLVPVEPIPVDKGSSLHIVCEYDNSAANPSNPDPAKTVKFGQRSDRSEMCTMGLLYVER